MSPERWKQIEEVFQIALDMSPRERREYIDQASENDPELKDEVSKLLSQFEEASSFIEQPLYDQSQAGVLVALMNEDNDPMLGSLLGSYRIEREVGRGGMGAVYEAVRADGVFRRRVAIKLVKRGMDTDFILRRFRNERQILAALEHPNITMLLDGGTTDDGRPYFVMDFIEGLPLYKYCDTKRMGVEERLKLFICVCEAVEYAHQNMVIHRDLKPSNILVANDGTPKLLDFGIAKLLNPDMAADTLQPTATALRMMTVDYASPEQVRGSDITYLSDVYSLGVILYELLTGHRPYAYRSRLQHDIARAICEDDPTEPSMTVLRTEGAIPLTLIDENATTISNLAEVRGETPTGLQSRLSGNLDNITLKALRKDPQDRYQSVAELKADIEKHLKGSPISAPSYKPERKNGRPEQRSETKLIAVLPLKLLSISGTENTDETYLSIGLADAIISRLASVRSFTVRPTSSIQRYENEDVSPIRAGKELGVEFILEGRIKKAADRIRVSLQLLNVESGATIWAGQFDENFTDVLQLEDAISSQVAEALIPQLTGEEKEKLAKRGTNNAEAYEAYLRGRFYWNQFTGESLFKSLAAYQRAIELDPDYALAYVGIADFYNWINVFGLMPSNECYDKATAAAERAMEIDDQLGEAYAAMCFAVLGQRWDWVECDRLVKKALQYAPNYWYSYECLAYLYTTVRNFDQGIAAIKRAEELDPLSPRAILMTSWIHYQSRYYAEAISRARRTLEFDANFAQGYLHMGNSLSQNKRAEEAVAALEKSLELMPGFTMTRYMLTYAQAAAGQMDEARAVVEELRRRAKTEYVKPYFIALGCIAIGEIDEAFEWLDNAFAEGDVWLIWIATEPKLDPIRKDPRYENLLQRMKHPLTMRDAAETVFDTGGDKSIAVLPFKLLNSRKDEDTGDEYLGVGLADSLITRLSNIRRLVVRPTSSILHYESDTDPFKAGRELNVDFVLDGNIRHFGESNIRVTVQLSSVREGAARWAGHFDEEFTDVLSVEDAISTKVVETLLPQLTGEERKKLAKRGTNNPKAYEAYQRGRFYWNQFTPDSLPKALKAFQKAVAYDPKYALAFVGLAEFYVWASILGIMPTEICYLQARAGVKLAVELDPALCEAYAVLGLLASSADWKWDEAEKYYQHSFKLNPNYPLAHEWYAALLITTGRFEEGLREARRAEELDPLSLRAMTLTSWNYYQSGLYKESVAKANQILELDRSYPQGYLQSGNSLIHLGETEKAVDTLQKLDYLMPDSALAMYTLCFALVAAGKKDIALKVLDKLEILAKETYVKPYFLAMAHVAVGDLDTAFGHFETAFAEHDAWLTWFATEPKLKHLHNDPRYIKLLKSMNNPIFEKLYKA
ncbi:MAG TPA: protein kinase [Pyrinomonadaceae bacterium]|jgi:serine/threonine protein kinase/Flp pilus assembly protein TadD|nr:protein kinase [Pyrinomonadaceae bacterium]